MSYKMTVRVAASAGTASAEDIPQEIKDDLESMYAELRKGGLEGFVDFSADESGDVPDPATLTDDQVAEFGKLANVWANQASVYFKTREAGALRFRQLPSKGLPKYQRRFQITADLEANGKRNDQSKK